MNNLELIAELEGLGFKRFDLSLKNLESMI